MWFGSLKTEAGGQDFNSCISVLAPLGTNIQTWPEPSVVLLLASCTSNAVWQAPPKLVTSNSNRVFSQAYRSAGWLLWSGRALSCVSGQLWWAWCSAGYGGASSLGAGWLSAGLGGPLGSSPQLSSSTCLTSFSHTNLGLFPQRRQKNRKYGERVQVSWGLGSKLSLLPHSFGQSKFWNLPRFRRWGNRLSLLMDNAMHASAEDGDTGAEIGPLFQSVFHSHPETPS